MEEQQAGNQEQGKRWDRRSWAGVVLFLATCILCYVFTMLGYLHPN